MKIQSESKHMRSLSNDQLKGLLPGSKLAQAEVSRRARIAQRNERKRDRMLQKRLAKENARAE